ncbi:nucleotide kinase domain-containing protein [Enhygromyxa salina]|uniref:5-hmdU DNA kinase helical domain-containing protein n=1 Tax=Enhygromyxa salina TaxID=215803 RepID=A0A2S9YAI6_9BACT|nr:nucleotide kinase domain-containing protein [Enhygromyxa salina]PRQ02031.1 hypothetical protein ENSA7_56040 [Enhygromyxa salina]
MPQNRKPRTPLVVAKRTPPKPSDLYPVFWRFAAERHDVYLKRVAGVRPPWTEDAVLREYKFTNVYRASDRVSQYFIRMIYSEPQQDTNTVFLRTLLFKIFNKIETWKQIVGQLGQPIASSFDFGACARLLDTLRARGHSIYSGAYIMPSGGGNTPSKHRMHLELLKQTLAEGLPSRLEKAATLEDAYKLMLAVPTFGPFLAFQYAIDLNYTELLSHSEGDYVVAGPGALDGLSKIFEHLGDYTPAEAIHWLAKTQEEEFAKYGLHFHGLWGRPLQPVDVQNVFCEVSKYTRASHPDVMGKSGRTRIKQKFKSHGPLPSPFFPPKWGLNQTVEDDLADERQSTVAKCAREQISLPL